MNNNTSFLKIIAMVTMVIDHVGYIFFPDIVLLRIVGRISFPLFAYSVFIGYFKTSNLMKYIFRLLIFGLISQPVYMLVFDKGIFDFNIFFTFIVELLLIYIFDKKRYVFLPFIYLILYFVPFSYSYQIMFLPFMFYYLSKDKSMFCIMFVIMNMVLLLNKEIINFFSLLAIPFLIIESNVKININKWFYYLFYPVHLIIFYGIKCIL